MKKETLLVITIVVLFLLNLSTLGFLFFRRPPHSPGAGALDRRIISTLQLDEAQQQRFEQLKKAHHEQMQASDRAYRDALNNYFGLLKSDSVASVQRDSLQAILTRIQNDRAAVTFQHFADLKALCRPEQKQDFDRLLPDLLQVILPHRNRPNTERN